MFNRELLQDTELIELSQADADWQTKINSAIKNNNQPIYLVFPETVDSLAQIVTQASKEQWRLLICGNGTKLAWGKETENIQLVISTQKCHRLVEHAVGDLTVTVEAGIKLKDLQEILQSHNQFLPIDPAYPATATLGGIVATADTGSYRQSYGGIRDLLLGISFIRADGAVAKAGGRVVKNVAGYDLMKLFTGAYGTLGIISQLTFRTYPIIPTSQTLLLTGQGEAIDAITQTIRNSSLTPVAMDLLSSKILHYWELSGDVGLILRWQTIPESIQQQIERVKAIAKELNLDTYDYEGQKESDLWQQAGELTNLPNSQGAVTCKLGLAPTAAVDFLRSPEIINNNVTARIHANSGIGQLQLNSPNRESITKMRSHCQQNYGFLTILNAPTAIKQEIDVWGYQGNALKMMQVLKNQFDPQNILNCDRFLV